MNEVVKWGLIGLGAYLLWNAYANSQTAAAATTTTSAPPTPGATAVTTTTTAPAAAASAPVPAASVSIVGSVTNLGPNFSNALKANVSINGVVQNISIIPGGDAYNTAGQDISAALVAQGVNVQSLYAMMQAAYVPASTSSATSGTASVLVTQFLAVRQMYNSLLGVNPSAAAALKGNLDTLAAAIVAAGGTVPSGVSGLGRNYVLRGALMPRVGAR